jgi:hypothetical protein
MNDRRGKCTVHDSHDQQPAEPPGRSIRPGTAVPPTVLVADMGQGALYLQGWRAGPSAYLTAEDALGLRRELERAFGGGDVPPRDPGLAL